MYKHIYTHIIPYIHIRTCVHIYCTSRLLRLKCSGTTTVIVSASEPLPAQFMVVIGDRFSTNDGW